MLTSNVRVTLLEASSNVTLTFDVNMHRLILNQIRVGIGYYRTNVVNGCMCTIVDRALSSKVVIQCTANLAREQ